SDPVNWGWLCDRGRFNFQSGNSEQRLTAPGVRGGDDQLHEVAWNDAIGAAAGLIREALDAGGPQSIAVLGGARGTNEDAFAWARLAHDVIGTANVSAQLGDGLPVGVLSLPRATIDDAAKAATVILLGPDLKEELPVLYLRLRHAAVKGTTKIIELTPRPSGMTRYAWKSIAYEPGTQVGVVHQLLADEQIAKQLGSGPVVIVVGRANLAESSAATVAALSELRAALNGATVLPVLRRGNVVGATLLGMRPGVDGRDSRAALRAAAEGRIECLVLVGSDPLSDFPDRDLARRALAGARRIISVDTFLSPSTALADVVLPAAAANEKAGTTTNIEGRVTVVSERVTPKGLSHPDWMIAAELASALGTDLGFASVDEVLVSINELNDSYTDVTAAALAATPDGVRVGAVPIDPINPPTVALGDRNAYDYRLVVTRKLYDAAINTAQSPALAPLAVGERVHVHPLDGERIGVAAGGDVKVFTPRTSVIMQLAYDDSVVRGTAWVPFNQPGGSVGELIDVDSPVTDVRIEVIR
ncbi:MAG TPA: molybdopterin-dependent oxidoreductase, partial [Ilumatobacteraceae bacterium]|nr:molybdopterin-dependent oxidoreductase [Ilumatobacteraceae bacterium]